MAEALVDVLLERLATIAFNKVEKEFKLVIGVKKEVKSLTRNLEAIRAVLEDAEQRQVTEATVRRWLSELTQVSLDMDDVLDEWLTKVLKRQLEKQEKRALAIAKKVRHSAYSFIAGSKLRRLIHRRKIAGRIKELNERLALIDREKQSFNFQNTTRDRKPDVRQETSSLLIDKTFGRDKEKNLIVSKLLSGSSQEKDVPLIIPIVGMGGMGKTTLAQLVYNDEIVKSHFDKRMWVCVSDPFEEIKIAQAIIEELDSSKNSNVLQTLIQCIFELIKGKRFLLVLDDVWNPNFSQWEELVKPLRNGAMGSRILVTTRKEEVATLMQATTQMILLKELSEAFCLSLFYYNADMDESNVPKDFDNIGVQIVEKCNGLPLAAKTLGRLLRNKKMIYEWEVVLKSNTWELKEIQQDVFRPLLLSFHDLTPATKRCLLYCAIFPKDYEYNKDHLIELWMSQDYLNAAEIGKNYFENLVMRSFFQEIKINKENGMITCKIHDITHDFLQYLTEKECLILHFGFEKFASDRKELPNDKLHHLTLVNARERELVRLILGYKKLRTLSTLKVIHSVCYTIGELFVDYSIGEMFEFIVQLKSLRTLTLSAQLYFDEENISKSIGGLIHLRYLDLSGNGVLRELPGAMCGLYNLQTLRLLGCGSLERLDVRRLINLRHLYVEGCCLLGSIQGIDKLTHLQRLDALRVGDGGKSNKLEHLKDLNQLKGSLTIYIQGGVYTGVKNAAVLVTKVHLLNLILDFTYMHDAILGEREIMHELEPHAGLESLCIIGYKGAAFSDWLLSLHRLRVLTLEACPNIKVLPSLGKLASLESLYILDLDGVEKVGVEFLGLLEEQTSSSPVFGSFPKLKELSFFSMESWEEWEGVVEENSENNITIMPCLSQLKLIFCKELEALPDFLWKTPLQSLYINNSPVLLKLYRTVEGRAKISHIPSTYISEERTQLLLEQAHSSEGNASSI